MNTESPTHVLRIALSRLRRRVGDDPAVVAELDRAEEALTRLRGVERTARTMELAKGGRLKAAALDLLRLLESRVLAGVSAPELGVLNVAYRARISELRAAGYRVEYERASNRYFLRTATDEAASAAS